MVAAYKAILHGIIDKRPSGMRLKIARAIGKYKSFVSQITNPSYPIQVPARHLETIFEICRFPPEKREEFLGAYAQAYPSRAEALRLTGEHPHPHKTQGVAGVNGTGTAPLMTPLDAVHAHHGRDRSGEGASAPPARDAGPDPGGCQV